MGRLDGKVAIVTGGGRGLGKVYSLRMAEEGAKIAVADILDKEAQQTAEEINAKGGSAFSLKVDVTSEEDTRRMADETVQKFGRIDILINNAGLYYGITRKLFTEIPIEEWDRMMAINVKGPWLCARAVFPQMKKQGKGKIINISSESVFAGSKNLSHYIASKAAVIGLTRDLAAELGQYGIRVNVLAPGFTDTAASRTIGSIEKYDVSRIPLRRVQQPEDLVGPIIFFASDESDFITGATLMVDGGRQMY
ncbi:3-oxoacyl-ACP reductase FabG [Dehalococcoidia bacterium]|nr:3-oxoacyl-ACP reductase FabG [Dehalococcoidia bacterium]